MTELLNFDVEMDSVLECALDVALESKDSILDPKTRDCLPDSAFGIVYTSETEKDKNGQPKRYRKYPLVVKGNIILTKQLLEKALEYFNYCKPEYKEELARKILSVILDQKIVVTVSRNNAFLKYVKETKHKKWIQVIEVNPRNTKHPDYDPDL